jgi:hypothetical protein
MARAFNLTAELNLRGPSNVRLIVADIRRQLGSITADVDIRVNPATSRNLGALNSTLANLNQTLTRTQTNANAVTAAFNNMGRAIGAFNTNANNASRNVQNLTAAANTLNTNLTQVNRQARQTGNEFEEFGRQSALAVRRFAAFATVTSVIFKFTNALSGATQEFIDFNRELVRVAQVTDSALKDLNPLVGEITRLSSGLGVASQDLIQVSSTLAQVGLSARDTERALKALALSALAPSFDDLNETVEGSIALMRQFGISASGLEDALGSVNAVAAKFAVEASDLITAIQRTGGVFATASRGVSEGKDALNEFLAVFTSIRQTTRESAETIATGLRTIFTRIQRQDTIEALQQLGIQLRNSQGQFVGAFEAVRRLSQGLSKIDPRSREFAAISEELGGFRQIGKVIPLIQQFAVAQEALKVAQQGQGSLARDAATAQQSVANQITKVREEFNALVRSIGQSDSFQTFVKLSLDLASALIKLADSAKTVLPALTAIAAIRGASAIGSFATGFVGGLRRQNSGGYIRRFASGGLVPGSGNSDTIPAMLTPGEFVIRKNAVKTIGLGSLQSMNKYASGGRVQKFNAGGYSDEEWSKEMESIRRKYKLPSSSEIDAMSPAQKKAYEDRLGEIAFSSPSPGREKKAILAMKQRSARKSALGLFFSAAGMKRGPKAPPGMFEQTRAKYQGLGGITSVKPKFIAWGKGQGSFGDVVRGSEDKIRSQLSGVSLSHFNSLLQAGTLQNYLASGGKQGHIPPLKKAIYNILGVTGKNSGGYIQKFEKGGMAERKITRNMGDGTTGPRMFGLVGLRSGLSDSESLPTSLLEKTKTPKNRDVQLNIGTLSNSYKNGLDNQIEDDLYQSFATSVIKTGDTLAKQIGANTKPNQSKINKVLKGSGFTTVVGAALESALGLIGSPYLDKTESTKALDFPLGLGKAASLFGIPSRVPTDVTRTVGGFGKGSTQILNQIDRFIDATEAGEFTKAMKSKIRDRKGATLTPMLSSIKEKLGDKPVSAVAQAGIAFKLRKKYGLGRGGLNKPSLESSLSGLPTGQQRRFLDDLDSVATTGTFADASRYAKGGNVDNVPALLTPGEFVINKKAASRIGSSRLHQLNRADKIQGFNKGGVVQRFNKGGTPAGIGGNLSQRAVQQSADMEAAIQKIMMNLEKAAKSAQDAAYKQARSQGKTAQESLDIGRQQASAVVQRLAPTDTIGTMAAQRVIGAMGPTQNAMTGSGTGAAATQMSQAGLQFAASLQKTATPLQLLTQAAKTAGNGLLQVGKSSVMAAGRGAGSMISRIGGGVLNAVGLGGLSTAGQQPGARFAAGRQAVAARRAGGMGMGGMGSGMSGMGAMIATMAGGTIVDSLASAAGGEKTDTGRTISAVGSNVLNYGAMGAAIGGPWGAAAGAAIGLAAGLMEAKKAGEEYAQAQLESKAQIATEKSGQAIAAYSADPRKAGGREAAFAALTQATTAEDAAMNNKQTQKVGFFGKAANFLTMGAAGYRDQTTAELAESNMKGQEEGAKQARELLSLEMTRTGKTFAEISKSMKPEELKMLANNIAQADQNYVYFQTQRALEIKKLKDQGRNAEAAALQDQTNKEQAAMAENIAARSMKEADAGIMAERAAAASAALGIALEKATMTLEKSFEAMSQSLNKFGSTIEQSAKAREQIVSGQASLTGNTFNRDADILQNPSAYSTRERQQAMNRSASMLGSQGNLAVRTANFSGNVSDEASRLVANAPAGEDQAVTGQRLQATLIARIRETFGADTTLGRTLSANVSEVIQKKIDEAKEKGTAIDFNELVESALGPINKASQQASELLIKANERLAKSFEELGATSQAIADLQQQQADRTASLLEMQGTSRVGQKESLGMKVGLQERLMLRANAAARGTGLQGNQLNVANLVNRRAQLAQRQKDLQAQQAATEPMAATSPFAQQQLFKFQQELAKVNGELGNTDKALENLPQALEGAISDVTAEMSKRVGELEARKEAGAGFAEKLVGSTPQELQALGNTFNLLNNTIRGNITTIQNSKVAQQAYVASLQQGKTKQEALADAQSAFAAENKNALSMFNELSQMSGVKGPEMDRMRADLLENFAKAQGAGLERSPMFQKIISQLRMDPAQRAASDPVLKALQTQAEALRAQQAAATAELNAKNDQQMKLLEATGAKLVQDINDAKLDVEISVKNAAARAGVEVPQVRARGGIIYASNGTLARGTDTVPAMLTPGEFVVNAKATRQNLPLLQSINRSKGGSVRYFAEGGLNDISGVGAQTARNIQTNTMKENNRVQNNILSGVKNLGQKSESIKNDTAYATSNQLPNLSDVTYDSKELNSQNFGYLIGLTERIYGFTQGIPSFMSDMTGNIGALLSLGSDISSGVLAGLALLMQGNAANLPNNQQGGVARAGGAAIDMLGELFGNMFSRGGPVYASKGKLINFEPKGTDTVPAMLTPGEFVVNRQATQKNLPLLQAINGGAKGYSKGGTVYLARGGEVSLAEDVAKNNLFYIEDLFNQFQQKKQRFISGKKNQFEIYSDQGFQFKDLNKIISEKDVSPASLLDTFRIAALYEDKVEGGGQQYKAIKARNEDAKPVSDQAMQALKNKLLKKEFMLAKKAVIDPKGKGAALTYEGALIEEYNRVPNIFEKFNQKAFTEQAIDEVDFKDKLQTKEQKENAFSVLNDRSNYLFRVGTNNNKALVSFMEDAKNRTEPRKFAEDIAAKQLFSAEKEFLLIQRLLRDPIFAGLIAPPNRFENNLFALDSIPSSLEEISARAFNRGGVVYANNGQLINFQPRGRDTVPAMLTPGEFVVNKNAAQKNLSLLQGMNSGQVSYLSNGTPGSDMFASLTQAISLGAKQLNTAFLEAIQQLTSTVNNNLPNTITPSPVSPNGVSNITAANIDLLGSRLDRFIEQLQAALPPVIRVEGQHDVNVVINGASALQNLLQGPISSLIQNAIQSAFNSKSRENEGN